MHRLMWVRIAKVVVVVVAAAKRGKLDCCKNKTSRPLFPVFRSIEPQKKWLELWTTVRDSRLVLPLVAAAREIPDNLTPAPKRSAFHDHNNALAVLQRKPRHPMRLGRQLQTPGTIFRGEGVDTRGDRLLD